MKEHDSTALRSGSIPFKPHARLLRLLGDELISDEVMAIVELVKNGYDADATRVIVSLNDIAGSDQGQICVKDDGHGMDLYTLLNVWMEPATYHKRSYKNNKKRTARGRIPTGEKGVGRFAADKLGTKLELITRAAGAAYEVILQVNWKQFEEDNYLDDVKCDWYIREPVEFTEDTCGTLLIIRSLRSIWRKDMIEKLNQGLVRLIVPFSNVTDFTIELDCPEYPSVSGKLVNHLFDTAPYKTSGVIDEDGLFLSETGEVTDLKPLCHNHFVIASGDVRKPLCGPFKISLNVWDLELQLGKGLGVDRSLRESIKASSGVSIYRDSFRIWPYGEKDDDWLELNQRRVNNPTLRISNNQVIGFIEITHADNPDLKDRTSREGLIDTQAFYDLKSLSLALIAELEVRRFNQRRQLSVLSRPTDEDSDEVLLYLSKLDKSEKSNVKEIEKVYHRRLEQEQIRYRRIATMAGIGLAAEVLSDSFSKEIDNTVMLLHILQREAKTGSLQLQDLIGSLSKHIQVINEQLDMLDPLYHPQKENNEALDVKGTVYDVISALRHKLAETNTGVSIIGEQGVTVRMGRGHLMLAMMILVDNALKTMKEASVENPRIAIEIIHRENFCGLAIVDNGPGIAEKYRQLIFEPSFTLRKNGRGLGLHIARDILASYNASLELSKEPVAKNGASFEIRFDKRRIVKHTKSEMH